MTRKQKLLSLALCLMAGWAWWYRADLGQWFHEGAATSIDADHSPTGDVPPGSIVEYPTRGELTLPSVGMVNPDGTVRRALSNTEKALARDGKLADSLVAKIILSGTKPFTVRSERVANGRRVLELGDPQTPHKLFVTVSASDVFLWNSIALRVVPHQNAPRTIPLYADPKSCEELIRNGVPSSSPRARVSITDASKRRWPLLEKKTVVVEGRSVELLHVLVPATDDVLVPATDDRFDLWAIASVPDEPVKQPQPVHSGLELVFVFDGTTTAEIMMPAARALLTSLLRRLSEGSAVESRPAFAAIVFRDYCEGLYFGPNREVTQVLGPGGFLTDADKFLELIHSMPTAPVGSEDIPEAMFDGLFVAVKHLPWRASADSRVVVLFNDSPGHLAKSPKNPFGLSVATITRLARERNVRIVSLFIEGAGGAESQSLHRRQCEELAAQTGGLCLPLAKATERLPQLAEFLRNPDHTGWPDDSSPNSLVSEIKNVKDWIDGWVVSEVDQRPLFEFEVLLTGVQFDLLLNELQTVAGQLRAAGQEQISREPVDDDARLSEDDATNLHLLQMTLTAGRSLFFNQVHRLSLGELLRCCGVPISDDLLSLTQRQFLKLRPAEKIALADRIERVLPALKKLSRDADGLWVPRSLLP